MQSTLAKKVIKTEENLFDSVYKKEHYEEYAMNGKSKIFEEIIDKMMLEYFDDDFKNKICNLPVDKKRMMILCLLDKDINLFVKAKQKIQDNKPKLKHIKDLILILREYVHVGEVEKKKHGEVMTPLELVKEMLATLPEEVWTNPNLKWLDSCNGTGPFLAMVVYKLMIGLIEWQPDEEKRYKHILENMIYAGELQAKNMFLWLTLMAYLNGYL
jgi:type I restriction-modification system DNA methylase subunit